jgi:hypothetical protein
MTTVSPPDLVVAFLQCDRPEYTRRTLDSFTRHAAGIAWEGWYADDASTDQASMISLVESYGLKPAVVHDRRGGCTPTTFQLVKALTYRYEPETLVLYLQNDFEFLRLIPLREIRELLEERPDVGWVRLAGAHNSGPDRPAINEAWCDRIPPAQWWDYSVGEEVFDVGRSYFCYNPPPVVHLGLLYYILQESKSEKETAYHALELGKLAARFKNNVAIHVGLEKTYGFKS